MAVGFTIGDVAWNGTVPLDDVFQFVAAKYQAGQTYAVEIERGNIPSSDHAELLDANKLVDEMSDSLANHSEKVRASEEASAKARNADFPRILYNVKQIAFNTATFLIISSLALTALGMVSIFYGACFTAAFLCIRVLISHNIRVMLTPVRIEGSIRESNDPDLRVLDDTATIWEQLFPVKEEEVPHATLREEWNPAYKVGGVAIWRNLVRESDLQRLQ